MALADELQRIAAAAATHAAEGEELAGILAAEPSAGARVYLCAYTRGDGERGWLALDGDGVPVRERRALRDAASIAALCELAAETAGGGDLEQLRSDLMAVRLRENPPGIDEAEAAALALERIVGDEPRVATPQLLDEVGAAVRRLERALGDVGGSPFAAAMHSGLGAVDSLTAEVEAAYKLDLA